MKVSKSINLFLDHCKYEKNLSENTLVFYKVDLYQLLDFLVGQEIFEVELIDKNNIKSYVQNLAKFQPRTIKRKVASSKSFLNFLEFEDHIVVNPFRKVKIRIKEPQDLPTVLEFEEMKTLLKTVKSEQMRLQGKMGYSFGEKLRDLVVLELLFATGVRVSELCDLKIDDISLTSGSVLIRGKGSKQRIAQICNEETLQLMNRHYAFYKDSIDKTGFFLSAA